MERGKYIRTEQIRKKNSDSLKGRKGINRGPRNGMWRGEKVKYGALHGFIKYYLPKPKFCPKCGKEGLLDLINKSGKYLRDFCDWEWMCRKCHMKEDGRLKNLEKIRTYRRKLQRDENGRFVPQVSILFEEGLQFPV